ncbi:MAG: ECF transporter S component [Lachnospiraceae bacterium]|nr:ECF transporter S component [Lachnospiraceae bacterium]
MKLKKIILSGIFIAIAIILPFFTGQLPQIGAMLSPMHIPALLCGFVCGWPYGAIAGFISPLLRSILTGGFPPMFPTAIAMAFELFGYGTFTALLSGIFGKSTKGIYISLVLSMILGRIIWGVVMFMLTIAAGSTFTFALFVAGAFTNAIPGIIIHIVIIPFIVIMFKKAGIINEKDN